MKEFYTPQDVAKILQRSIPAAYRIIRNLNLELEKDGYSVACGRCSARYFHEKYYIAP